MGLDSFAQQNSHIGLSSLIAGLVAGLVYFVTTVAVETILTGRTVFFAVVVAVSTFVVAFLVITFIVREN